MHHGSQPGVKNFLCSIIQAEALQDQIAIGGHGQDSLVPPKYMAFPNKNNGAPKKISGHREPVYFSKIILQ
jgi:hypothetical protein